MLGATLARGAGGPPGWAEPGAPERSPSGTLPDVLVSASALGQTLALLATFLGIGVLVNLLVMYVVAQVMAERKQNQERQQGLGR